MNAIDDKLNALILSLNDIGIDEVPQTLIDFDLRALHFPDDYRGITCTGDNHKIDSYFQNNRIQANELANAIKKSIRQFKLNNELVANGFENATVLLQDWRCREFINSKSNMESASSLARCLRDELHTRHQALETTIARLQSNTGLKVNEVAILHMEAGLKLQDINFFNSRECRYETAVDYVIKGKGEVAWAALVTCVQVRMEACKNVLQFYGFTQTPRLTLQKGRIEFENCDQLDVRILDYFRGINSYWKTPAEIERSLTAERKLSEREYLISALIQEHDLTREETMKNYSVQKFIKDGIGNADELFQKVPRECHLARILRDRGLSHLIRLNNKNYVTQTRKNTTVHILDRRCNRRFDDCDLSYLYEESKYLPEKSITDRIAGFIDEGGDVNALVLELQREEDARFHQLVSALGDGMYNEVELRCDRYVQYGLDMDQSVEKYKQENRRNEIDNLMRFPSNYLCLGNLPTPWLSPVPSNFVRTAFGGELQKDSRIEAYVAGDIAWSSAEDLVKVVIEERLYRASALAGEFEKRSCPLPSPGDTYYHAIEVYLQSGCGDVAKIVDNTCKIEGRRQLLLSGIAKLDISLDEKDRYTPLIKGYITRNSYHYLAIFDYIYHGEGTLSWIIESLHVDVRLKKLEQAMTGRIVGSFSHCYSYDDLHDSAENRREELKTSLIRDFGKKGISDHVVEYIFDFAPFTFCLANSLRGKRQRSVVEYLCHVSCSSVTAEALVDSFDEEGKAYIARSDMVSKIFHQSGIVGKVLKSDRRCKALVSDCDIDGNFESRANALAALLMEERESRKQLLSAAFLAAGLEDDGLGIDYEDDDDENFQSGSCLDDPQSFHSGLEVGRVRCAFVELGIGGAVDVIKAVMTHQRTVDLEEALDELRFPSSHHDENERWMREQGRWKVFVRGDSEQMRDATAADFVRSLKVQHALEKRFQEERWLSQDDDFEWFDWADVTYIPFYSENEIDGFFVGVDDDGFDY